MLYTLKFRPCSSQTTSPLSFTDRSKEDPKGIPQRPRSYPQGPLESIPSSNVFTNSLWFGISFEVWGWNSERGSLGHLFREIIESDEKKIQKHGGFGMVEILSQNYTQTPKNLDNFQPARRPPQNQNSGLPNPSISCANVLFSHVFAMTFQGVRGMMVGTAIDENIAPFCRWDLWHIMET